MHAKLEAISQGEGKMVVLVCQGAYHPPVTGEQGEVWGQ